MKSLLPLFSFLAIAVSSVFSTQASDRPNILWIIVDDMSANFSCYGETLIETPHVDQLAKEGIQFTKAFVTAPVCSTCRSAFITGMYQTSIGAQHHRSGRGELKIHLPEGVRPIPELFREAGYHTSVGGWPGRKGRLGKTDYNFEWDKAMYDGADWSKREEGQPFFAQIQLPGGKLRGGTIESAEAFAQKAEITFGSRTKATDVVLAPYYPRNPVLLHDWASYLDTVKETDRVVGEILQRLEDDGVRDDTVVLFMTDHGISHARGKQFLYDEGIHVPLVIAGPKIPKGKVRDDLVEHIDIAALSLGLAGIPVPEWMQAQDILDEDYEPRKAVYSARDRCDETVDHIRSVRTQDFKYIRNFLYKRPMLQPCAYKDHKSILIALRAAHAKGKLDETQELLFQESRPKEELYDLKNDPFEINNLAEDPAFQEKLVELRGMLDTWMEETNDQGRTPESWEMYDSDMAPYLSKKRGGPAKDLEILQSNIKVMKMWAAKGM